MEFNTNKISSVIKDEILNFTASANVSEAGRVHQVGDGIARVIGMQGVMSGELLEFENGTSGIAMNLEEDNVGVVLLGNDQGINEGDFVTRTKTVAQVGVGDAVSGRIVDALGRPIDREGPIEHEGYRPIERVAHGVLARRSVGVPLQTGIKAIDAMVPIGRGQRQLIIGDRQTGKTAITIDTIINQKDTGVKCVYCAIGQKNSTISGLIAKLNEHGAMSYTTVVVAGAAESAALQYLAPYSACAIAEHWMENGKDVLIIYDDLSKHAVAHRTMSLLMRRPPGREAYPGDVFYLHSRLLERAGRLTEKYGGGSITALPIIETQGGNMSAYIPTNVISITDGQIYLESESFNAGIRPAVNPGLSVSRVGGAAQVKAMKKIAAPIRMELAQYRELMSFAQFSSDLDQATKDRLNHGERIVEVLKQRQYEPLPVEQEIIILFAVTKYLLAGVNVEKISDYEQKLLAHIDAWHKDILDEIREKHTISDQIDEKLTEAIEQFNKGYK